MIKTKPNLPEGKAKILISSEQLDKRSVDCLKKQGAEIVFFRGINTVDRRLSHHTDLGLCLADAGVLYVCPSCAGDPIVSGVKIISGSADPGEGYPEDCSFNVCIIGKYAIHDFAYTDSKLYGFLKDRYELINVKQGYSKCMISVVSEKCVMTQDAGITKTLEKAGFDVLHINEKNIRLEGFPYGFIGGASFLLDEKTWCINGSLEKLDSCYNIENALEKKGIGIICLNDDFPVDVGSFIQLFEEERCYEKNLNMLNMIFILLLLLIYSFVTYLFIDSDIEFVHFIIISIAFAIMVAAYNTNVLTGLVISAVAVFGLGTYLFYADYLSKTNDSRYVFFWILVFPASALLAGYYGNGISKISEKVVFLEEELVKLITKDELTGFDNIREFYNDLDEKMSSSKRHKYDLTLMLVEIGHYDDMLAVYGKTKMEEYIKLFSQLIASTIRLEDNRYRLYEDTFALILQHTNAQGAARLEERINETFSVLKIHDAKSEDNLVYGLRTAYVQYNESIRSSLDFRDLVVEMLRK